MEILILLINIILMVFCGKLGQAKGYSFILCLVAGFFFSFIALIVILLLPDLAEQQAYEARREQRHKEEVDALKDRIAALERMQPAPETDAQGEASPQPEAPQSPPGTPAHFPSRTTEVIACPRCGKRQRGDRDLCYSCKAPFLYDDEAPSQS